uniref:Putative bel-1 bm-i n=1 Tax=Xenopsylla cheopis TaxID=163159 RepID=A0A6M2DYB5_XENCH
MSRHRGARTYKAYICLFICLATKAVHLELASDLTSDTFLDCLKRFLARRGPIECIYSECGTNFVGARNTLNSLFHLLNPEEYKRRFNNLLIRNSIEWKLNPPVAPHFGGIWEANIKSVKKHLFKVIGIQILSYEEFNTVLNQIEALLNSRPLSWLSNDPSDPLPLTPAHFLMQEPLSDLPVDYENLNLTKRKQLLDQIVASYWKRWSGEYLTELQVRQKWNTVTNPIKKGQLVVVKDENARPLHWGLGIIEEVFPGPDGVVRVASVKIGSVVIKRPVVKLCPLPIE